MQARIGSLAAAFVEAGHRFFLVGGLVRDAVLGLGLRGDIDITTDAAPEQTAELVARWADAVWEQGKRFGTIGARRAGTTVEITTHRAESYDSGSRKPLVRFSDDVTTDLGRRDFTVNAMAIELPGWTLLDPYDGRADLSNGVLRTPAAPESLFADDPLRMLRAARFSAQLSLRPTVELLAAVRSTRPRLAIVSRERIEDELTKLLGLPRPAAGIRLLSDTGLLGDLLPPWRHARTAVPAEALDDVVVPAVDHDERVARRWALLLGPVCDDAAAAQCLSALRCRAVIISRVAAMLRAIGALEAAVPGSDRGAPDAWRRPARRLVVEHETALDAAQAVLAGRGRSVTESLASELAQVRADEGDELRRLPVDGHRIMDVLGCSGAIVGEAAAWLRSQQIEHGPMSAERADDLLAAWSRRREHADRDQAQRDQAQRDQPHRP
ncbi:CCA tRNA nucleotidyltransferase [Candidatus Poriferisodalis sp.]|uniref:CCA tRNA nucleotidyltransferase n=1 Tax=Candidatus Poriferisodalis sp. TaxID=3101277 RepID=UPI003B01DF34